MRRVAAIASRPDTPQVDHDQIRLVVVSQLDRLRSVEGLCNDDDAGTPQSATQRAARRTPVVGDDRAPLGSLLTKARHESNATEFRTLSCQRPPAVHAAAGTS